MTRRRVPVWLLFVLLVAAPLAELWFLIQVGQVVGPWWTIFGLVLAGLVGSWLIRREGIRTWNSLRTSLAEGRTPTRELADGALIVLGGALMLAPGFLSDAFGVLLVLPLTRPVARRLVLATLGRRLLAVASPFPGGGAGGGTGRGARGPWDARRPGPGPEGPVVRGDVVDQ